MRGKKTEIIKKGITYFLVFFFIVTTSLWVHELIHVYQLERDNQQIDEVCLTGWKSLENDNAVGWVKSFVHDDVDEGKMENEAILTQIIYVAVLGFIFSRFV